MPFSRYTNIDIIRNPQEKEPAHFFTYDLPESLKVIGEIDWFDGERPKTHTWVLGDRLDKIAEFHLGDATLWWVLATCNKIGNPLAISPGTKILIPVDKNSVLSKLNLR